MAARWVLLIVVCVAALPHAAHAQGSDCPRSVLVALPGVRWEDVRPGSSPALLEAARRGAAGSVSVRTNTSRTSYASGFATVGAGARVDAVRSAGGPVGTRSGAGIFTRNVAVSGVPEMLELAEDAGYGARPGALAAAVPAEAEVVAIGNSDAGNPVPIPVGSGRYALLAAMHPDGIVDLAATGPELLEEDPSAPFGVRTDVEALLSAVDDVLAVGCSQIVIDPGDLVRADRLAAATGEPQPEAHRAALAAADRIVAHLLERLDPRRDQLLIVSPTSPAWLPAAHLGVAVAVGPGFRAGETLVSASTRRAGIVTLPDVAPTILDHLGVERPASMTGRRWVGVEARGDPVAAAVALNDETVFVDAVKSPINTAFVVFQIAVYVLAFALLTWRERRGKRTGTMLGRNLELAGLGIVAFPLATFLAGIVEAHRIGAPGYVALLLALDAALVAVASMTTRLPLDRLLVLASLTLLVIAADLVSGSRLQMNTVFGYSPVVAGRFSGAGNIAFSVLGATAVVTASLVVHRYHRRPALGGIALLFAAVVVIDGAPQFGSDVGGVIALVPGFAITWLLLAGIRPSARAVAAAVAAAAVALGVFLAVDVSRPPEDRTHLAQLFERAREDGGGVLVDTVRRKAAANVRVFRSSIYTFFVPPALAIMAWLVLQPRGRWQRLAEVYPRVRAGLIGGLLVAVLGFAVNDSGIVIPAVVLSFLVPMALMLHLALELGERR